MVLPLPADNVSIGLGDVASEKTYNCAVALDRIRDGMSGGNLVAMHIVLTGNVEMHAEASRSERVAFGFQTAAGIHDEFAAVLQRYVSTRHA